MSVLVCICVLAICFPGRLAARLPPPGTSASLLRAYEVCTASPQMGPARLLRDKVHGQEAFCD